jgi:alanyl-tRNA synthetase
MGLERATAVLQGHVSTYDTDAFTPLLAAIGERAGSRHHGTMAPTDVSMRVVADHLRAMTFLIGDGVVPSNESRGYVLRKIMRRAMRHGKKLGLEEPFLYTLVDTVAGQFGDAYPELLKSREAITRLVRSEEERFDAVLTNGLPRLEQALDKAAAQDGVVAGEVAFRLYDTHGIPPDFIEDTIESRGLRLDRAGYERAMEEQRETARAKSTFKSGAQDAAWTATDEVRSALEAIGDQIFRGYETTTLNSRIVAMFDERRRSVDSLAAGEHGFIALAETPFYLEAGGQVSDVGRITAPHGEAQVTGVLRAGAWPRLHAVQAVSGVLKPRDLVTADVSSAVRDSTRRHHTATHLLHAALRQVLGPHVKQAGSLVAPDRLRFDFVHFAALTREQILEIEQIVNEYVLGNTPVQTEVKATDEAIAAGAMALFGEKYGDRVRVVSIPGFSVELCGGTHVRATGDIGLFAILSESGVAAGVRRLEAICGLESLKAFQRDRDDLAKASAALTARPGELAARATALVEENRRLARELQQTRMKAALSGGGGGTAGDETIDIGGVKLVAREVSGLDKNGLRTLVDQHRDKIKSGVVVLASPSDGKVVIVVGVTPDLTARVSAGEVVKQLAPVVGGRGGGRPDFAEAGGKDPSRIGELLAASRVVLEKMLNAQGDR